MPPGISTSAARRLYIAWRNTASEKRRPRMKRRWNPRTMWGCADNRVEWDTDRVAPVPTQGPQKLLREIAMVDVCRAIQAASNRITLFDRFAYIAQVIGRNRFGQCDADLGFAGSYDIGSGALELGSVA